MDYFVDYILLQGVTVLFLSLFLRGGSIWEGPRILLEWRRIPDTNVSKM
jgi:hypothetical protein